MQQWAAEFAACVWEPWLAEKEVISVWKGDGRNFPGVTATKGIKLPYPARDVEEFISCVKQISQKDLPLWVQEGNPSVVKYQKHLGNP